MTKEEIYQPLLAGHVAVSVQRGTPRFHPPGVRFCLRHGTAASSASRANPTSSIRSRSPSTLAEYQVDPITIACGFDARHARGHRHQVRRTEDAVRRGRRRHRRRPDQTASAHITRGRRPPNRSRTIRRWCSRWPRTSASSSSSSPTA
ncbi:MAG: hypothetical protein MZU97_11795 [Bacillus subtilis]|nr:hypothetical protein [Bacillus subtilis]